MKCHEMINASFRVFYYYYFFRAVPFCGIYLSGFYTYLLTNIKAPVRVLSKNLKDTGRDRMREMKSVVLRHCVSLGLSLGPAERKLKWWLHKCTNGLEFLPAVPWAVNSRTASVWPASYARDPLCVQDEPIDSLLTGKIPEWKRMPHLQEFCIYGFILIKYCLYLYNICFQVSSMSVFLKEHNTFLGEIFTTPLYKYYILQLS